MDFNYLNLHNHCTVSSGYTRGAIFDLKSQKKWFIPLRWAHLLSNGVPIKINEIQKQLNHSTEADIQSFLKFLVDENIAFLSSKRPRSTSVSRPKKNRKPVLNEVSVEVVNESPLLNVEEIEALQIKILVLYLQKPINMERYLAYYADAALESIDLVLAFEGVTADYLRKLKKISPRIRIIELLQDAKKQKKLESNKSTYLTKPVFFVNEAQVNLSKIGHSYYYSRAHITAKGFVKNGPHTKEIFGHLKRKSLKDIVKTRDFQQLWYVKKSAIDVCADCEFSMVCEDRRVLKKRGNGFWYALTECAYNPYICLEEGDEEYRNLNDCGVHCTKQGFCIEVDLFIAVKERVWGNLSLTT